MNVIKIFIMRHGRTDFNDQDKYLGVTDISLNEKGRWEAMQSLPLIKELNIDFIISSPLKRTIETAKFVKPCKVEIIIDKSFIERSVGVYEGLTKEECKKRFPDLYNKNVTRIFDEAPPEGETIHEVQNRVFKGLNEIKKLKNNKSILIVTHGFVAKIINKYFNPQISEKEFYDFTLSTAEIKEYTCIF